MARNTKTSKNKLVKELEKTPIVEVACRRVGVPRATYYRWRSKDPEFAGRIASALEKGVDQINDLAESKIIKGIHADNMTAVIFWLKHNKPGYEPVSIKRHQLVAEDDNQIDGFTGLIRRAYGIDDGTRRKRGPRQKTN